MNKKFTLKMIVFIMSALSPLLGEVYHNYPDLNRDVKAYVWEMIPAKPFDEMMISWNASRPVDGDYRISVMVLTDEWSSWMLYMQWGAKAQTSFDSTDENGHVTVYQDGISILHGKKAIGFRVRIDATEEANLNDLWAIHAFAGVDGEKENRIFNGPSHFLNLGVPSISQMTLPHPRAMSLCSPTSTAAVVNYLHRSENDNPLHFAANVHDRGFDIYGNWVLNLAQASHELGKQWQCWVQKAESFEVIFKSLEKKIPVVVSIRGPLMGSLHPYDQGHLLVVKGYDPMCGEVFCMDPAYPSDEETEVSYPLADFVAAWMRRGQIVYLFDRR